MKDLQMLKKGIQKNKNAGITLIALVVTIIVLLILAAISITILTGDDGLLARATESKEESRVATVQDERDLWKMNQDIDKQSETEIAESLDELLEKLGPNEKNILTADEVEQIKKTGQVTIGKRTVVFKEVEKSITECVNIGDYVDYKAGDWTNKDIALLGDLYYTKNPKGVLKRFVFAGFESGDSKDSSYIMFQDNHAKEPKGWRVFKIDYNNNEVTIIHAGIPEAFYAGAGIVDGGFEGEFVLKGSVSKASYNTSNLKSRNWSMYENDMAKVGSARLVSYEEINSLSQNDPLRAIGSSYYLPYVTDTEGSIAGASAENGTLMHVSGNGSFLSERNSTMSWFGLRPIVTLKSTVMVEASNNDKTHTTYDTAWHLK